MAKGWALTRQLSAAGALTRPLSAAGALADGIARAVAAQVLREPQQSLVQNHSPAPYVAVRRAPRSHRRPNLIALDVGAAERQ